MKIADIIALAPKYSLLDCYRVLYNFVRDSKGQPLHEIRLRPVLSLALPAKQVHRIIVELINNRNIYTIEVNLAGLYGQLSPLPTFFTEELIQSDLLDLNQAKHFLDLLHQRFYQIFIAAQQQHTGYETEQQVEQSRSMMLSLAGLRGGDLLQQFPEPALLLRYVNLLRHERGTVLGIQQLFSGLFATEDLVVQAYQLRQVTVANECVTQLGCPKHGLGQDALVGNKISDGQSKILIMVNGIKLSTYNKWMLNQRYLQGLQQLTRFILNQPCLVDLCFSINASAKFQRGIGQKHQHLLGKNIWLGNTPVGADKYEANIRLL